MNEQPGAKGSFSITWSESPRGRSGPKMSSHRLNENVVFAVEQGGPGVLVQGLHIVSGGEGWAVIHAATRMPLLDLVVRAEVEEEARSDLQGPHAESGTQPNSPTGSHCPSHSRRGLGAWWASPVADANCGCGASGRARRQRGRSRSDPQSSSWCIRAHRAPLPSRWGLATLGSGNSALPSTTS